MIKGNLSFGALVAVLAAYKDLASPWKELLDFYQNKENSRITYDQIVEQFEPANMVDETLLLAEPETIPHLTGELTVANLSLAERRQDAASSRAVNFTLGLDEHAAIIGQSGSGKDELGAAARPAGAADQRAHHDRRDRPRRAAGGGRRPARRRMSTRRLTVHRHAARQSAARAPSPPGRRRRASTRTPRRSGRKSSIEARRAGNIDLDIDADWIDYNSAGVADATS